MGLGVFLFSVGECAGASFSCQLGCCLAGKVRGEWAGSAHTICTAERWGSGRSAFTGLLFSKWALLPVLSGNALCCMWCVCTPACISVGRCIAATAAALLLLQDLPFKETKLPPLSPLRANRFNKDGSVQMLSPSSKSGWAGSLGALAGLVELGQWSRAWSQPAHCSRARGPQALLASERASSLKSGCPAVPVRWGQRNLLPRPQGARAV